MKVNLEDIILNSRMLKVGQRILLTGTVYTARDVAHERIISILDNNGKLPFDLKDTAIYYCGPIPAKPGVVIGACGPTTSSRMDIFTPKLLKNGVKLLIGKGNRSDEIVNSIKDNGAIYLVATGGVAALLSKTVQKSNLIAFEDLGSEAIYKLEVKNMPLIVAIDNYGNNIFKNCK